MTTTDEARELLEAIDQTVGQIVVNARRQYIVGLEVAIKRYQYRLWQTVTSYEQKLSLSVGDSGHHKIVVVNLIADLTRLGEQNLYQAANVGFERALADLLARGWIKQYAQPVVAPRDVVADSIAENRKYLEQSLLPDLHRALDAVKNPDDVPRVLASFRARIFMYGHWMWRTAERAYRDGMKKFFVFYDHTPLHESLTEAALSRGKHSTFLQEGGSGSGNFAHVGRPGQVGGSAFGFGAGPHKFHTSWMAHDKMPLKASLVEKGLFDTAAYIPPEWTKDTTEFDSMLNAYTGKNKLDDTGINYHDASAAIRSVVNVGLGRSANQDILNADGAKKVLDNHSMDTLVRGFKIEQSEAGKQWDKAFPRGGVLYRGIQTEAFNRLFGGKVNVGDVIHFPAWMSTSDAPSFARMFQTNPFHPQDQEYDKNSAFLKFEGVKGQDIGTSYTANPSMFGFGIDNEIDMVNSRDWQVVKAVHPWANELTLRPVASKRASMKESESSRYIIIKDDLGAAFPPNAQKLREGGVGSGNFAHAGRPGAVGGSAPASGANSKTPGHVQTASNEVGVDPNGPPPWEMKAPAPPRYPGDTSIYSPALPDAHGNFTLGRRLQGNKLNPPGDPNQIAMYTFIPARANTDQLSKYEGIINSHSDHSQLHPGTIAYKDASGQLQKTDGNNYWIRGDYRDLASLSDTLTPQLAKDFGHDTYTTMMTDVTPGGTKVTEGQPLDHIRVVVPFAADTPKNTVGEPSVGREGRDKILSVLSGDEGRHVWEHADFNGIHLATSCPAGIADKLMPQVQALGGMADKEEVQHSVGATRFIPTKINVERYAVRGLREADDSESPTALFVGPDDADTCDGCDEAVNGNPYTVDDVPEPGSFECMARCRHMVQLNGDAPADLAPFEWHGSIGFGELSDAAGGLDVSDLDAAVAERTAQMMASVDVTDMPSFADFADSGGFDTLGAYMVDNDLSIDDVGAILGLDEEAINALSASVDRALTGGIGEDELMYYLSNGDVDMVKQSLEHDPVTVADYLNDIAANGFDDADAIMAETLAQAMGKTAYVSDADGRWYVQ